MRRLLDEYARAVGARATAVQVSMGQHPAAGKTALLLHAQTQEVEAREALEAALGEVGLYLGNAISEADNVRTDKRILRASDMTLVAYGSQANDKVGVERYRKPTLKDAKRAAESIARNLRKAWQIVDPSGE